MAFKDISEIILVHSKYEEVLGKINDTIDRVKKLFPNYDHCTYDFIKHHPNREIRHMDSANRWGFDNWDKLIYFYCYNESGHEFRLVMPINFLFMDDTELDAALNLYREKYKIYIDEVNQDEAKVNQEKDLKLPKAKYPEGE